MRNHRTPTIARPRYVWIATTATSHDDGSETAQVLSQHETAEQARDAQLGLPNGGYEGPVPADRYPVGHTFLINDGQPA